MSRNEMTRRQRAQQIFLRHASGVPLSDLLKEHGVETLVEMRRELAAERRLPWRNFVALAPSVGQIESEDASMAVENALKKALRLV